MLISKKAREEQERELLPLVMHRPSLSCELPASVLHDSHQFVHQS